VTLVDTNVLVRLVMRDAPDHVAQAEAAVDTATAGELHVLDAVIDETCTVLGLNHLYGMPRELICDSLERILKHPAFETSDVARQALKAFRRQPKLNFVDCLLLILSDGRRSGVLTFDKDLQKALR
jgi:predicted nucleic acid-binding protein